MFSPANGLGLRSHRGGLLARIWLVATALIAWTALSASLPVLASLEDGQVHNSRDWLLRSPSRAFLSGAAEAALLWQNGLLELSPPASNTMATHELAFSSVPHGETDVRLNQPGERESGAAAGNSSPSCNTQTEVSIARSGTAVVAAWVDGGECEKLIQSWANDRTHSQDAPEGRLPITGISLSGFGYSNDGGKTWTDGGAITPPEGGNLFGNPVVAAGPDGAIYYATLAGRPLCCEIGVARSNNGGRTWSTVVSVSGESDAGALHDKPWIAVDGSDEPAYRGSLYVAWTEYAPDGIQIAFSRSTDGGQTFSDPLKLSTQVGAREWPGTGTQVAVGPAGEVYVIWTSLDRARVWFVRSLDGGVTFSTPENIALTESVGHWNFACVPQEPQTVGQPRFVINGDIRSPVNLPSLAVDASGSSDPGSSAYNPYRGRIYIAIPHDGDEEALWPVLGLDESDIAFIYSSDGGATWENVQRKDDEWLPTRTIDDDEAETDQFHPQVAVDDQGRVALSWYDRRVSGPAPPNWDMALFATISTDGGETFGDYFQVSDAPFAPPRTNPNANWLGGCYMGLYNGLVAGEDEFLVAWGDNRNGLPALPDLDVYFDRITFGASEASGGDGSGDSGVGGVVGGDVGNAGGGSGGDPDGGEPYVQPDLGGAGETAPPVTARCGDQTGNHIVGTATRDRLRGTPGPDVICGLGGHDRLRGLGGDDLLIGGPGRDLLIGGRGADVCLGGAGRDRIRRCEA